jgi:hypothetical protein
MPENGYGSELYLRARGVAFACREIDGRGPSAALGRLRAGSLTLARYERGLPAVPVRLSPAPAGRMIGEHLAIRVQGGERYRYRGPQGVLTLPGDFAQYLRGRHRQAVRTNVGHARRAGLTVARRELSDWEPGPDDTRRGLLTPGPIEHWRALDPAGGSPVAEAIVTVDAEVALLHGLGSTSAPARWLLHTEIVERLCGSCRVLLVNSDDAYLLGAGHQYFQRLLGYEIARLRLDRGVARVGRTPRAARIASRWGGSRYLTASRIVTPEARGARGSSHP